MKQHTTPRVHRGSTLILLPALAALTVRSVQAESATPSPAPPAVALRAELFPLGGVRLLDGPFQVAQQTDHDYLLELESDRLLAWFRKEAGLPPKAQVYPGWESLGIAGQSLGHYLSALATMWQATGDERLRERANYIVDELAACQDANGNGYIGAIPHGKEIFAQVARGELTNKSAFNFGNAWVPWYTMHKLFAGLIDVYERTGNEKARGEVVKLADWCGTVVGPLDEATMQRMLAAEHGGMAESLAEIYAITGRRQISGPGREIPPRGGVRSRSRAATTGSPACTPTRRFPRSSATTASTN